MYDIVIIKVLGKKLLLLHLHASCHQNCQTELEFVNGVILCVALKVVHAWGPSSPQSTNEIHIDFTESSA